MQPHNPPPAAMRYSMMKKSAGNMMIGNGNSCLVAKERIKDMMKSP